MSNPNEQPVSNRPDLDAIAAREQAASKEVARLCNGGRWEMQVPARDDADSDMVISAALADVRTLSEWVRRVTAVRDRYWKALESARRRAHRWSVRAEKATRDAKEAAQSARDSAAYAEQAWGEVDKLRAELETARREERERCAAALMVRAREAAASGDLTNADAWTVATSVLRTLPDDDTPTTEETPVSTELPDYIEIAYSHITRVWGVTCTACSHKMRNAGATEDAAAHVARMHLNHDHRGWDKTA